MSYWPLPILLSISSGVSEGPDANGVCLKMHTFHEIFVLRLWDNGVESEPQLSRSAMLYYTTDKLFRPAVKPLGKVQNFGRVVEKK
jgi:hypothetical protein